MGVALSCTFYNDFLVKGTAPAKKNLICAEMKINTYNAHARAVCRSLSTEGVLELCNGAVLEKTPQIFDLRCPLST